MSLIIWTTIIVAIAIYIFHKLLNINNKKKLPPGPWGLPILGHLHLIGKNPHQDFYKLAKRYGPFMHIQLGLVPTIVVSSPNTIEKILKTYDHVFASRPHHEASQHVCYGQRNLIFSKYGPYWRNMRKLTTMNLVSSQKINSYQPSRKEEVSLMVKSIKHVADHNDQQHVVAVDLSAVFSSLNANLSCLMVFGKKFMDDDLDKRGFKSLVQEVVHLAATPNLGDFFPYLGVLDLQGITSRLKTLSKEKKMTGENSEKHKQRKLLHQKEKKSCVFLEKIIDEHVESKEQRETKDFVDTMMDIMQSGEAGFKFDRRHVKAVLLDMLMASMDTSATSVEWILTELLRHPHVMKKLQKELEQVVGLDRMVEESHLENLNYLDMVIKEALRLHSALPLLIHESIEDCVVDGFFVQKGSRIVVNVYAAQRDPNAWPEPDKFLPERFVESSVDLRGHDFQLLPFGSGRRSCPGMQLGIIIVRPVVAQLVHCFDWELPNGMQPSELDMSEQFGVVTCRAKHLMAIPTYRLQL